MRDSGKLYTLLNEVAADGAGAKPLYVADFRTAILEVVMTAFTGTVKLAGGIGDSAPAIGTAQSLANPWDTIEMVDLEDGANIDGDAGLVGAATTDVRLFEVNVNGLQYLNAIVSNYSGAGTLTIRVRLYGGEGRT